MKQIIKVSDDPKFELEISDESVVLINQGGRSKAISLAVFHSIVTAFLDTVSPKALRESLSPTAEPTLKDLQNSLNASMKKNGDKPLTMSWLAAIIGNIYKYNNQNQNQSRQEPVYGHHRTLGVSPGNLPLATNTARPYDDLPF